MYFLLSVFRTHAERNELSEKRALSWVSGHPTRVSYSQNLANNYLQRYFEYAFTVKYIFNSDQDIIKFNRELLYKISHQKSRWFFIPLPPNDAVREQKMLF